MWAAFKRWLCAPEIHWLRQVFERERNERLRAEAALHELRPLAQLGREYRQILELRKAQPREKGRFVRVKKDRADA
jgi:hypothetical protein